MTATVHSPAPSSLPRKNRDHKAPASARNLVNALWPGQRLAEKTQISFKKMMYITVKQADWHYNHYKVWNIQLLRKNKMKPTNPNADTYVKEQRQFLFVTFSSVPTCETPWVVTLKWHSCRTPLLDTIAQRSGKTLLLDTLIWHSCVTLLPDTLVRHSRLTLL